MSFACLRCGSRAGSSRARASSRSLSGLGAAALGVVAVRRLGASWTAGLAAVAVVFAYYPASDYWYDLARSTLCRRSSSVAGLVLLARGDVRPSRASLVGGATLLVLAVFTKQTSVVVCAASLLFFVLARDGPRQRTLLAALVTLGGLGGLALLTAYGRDAFIIYWAPQRHFRNIPFGTLRFLRFAWTMLPLLGLAITGLRGSAQAPRGRALRFFLLNFAFAAAMGWLTLCKHGGDTNSSTPAIFLLAVCVGLGLEGSLAAPAPSWRPVAISWSARNVSRARVRGRLSCADSVFGRAARGVRDSGRHAGRARARSLPTTRASSPR